MRVHVRVWHVCTDHNSLVPLLMAHLQVFFDVKIDGEPAGRIVIALFPDAPAGSSRFRDLAVGREGIDYRLSKFNGVFPVRK